MPPAPSPPSPGRATAVYEALFELAPDAILVVDAGGRVVRMNAHAERVFGYGRDEVAGAPIEIFIPERMRTAHQEHRTGYVEHPKTRPMGVGLELLGRRKDGSEFPVEIALAPIDTEVGPVVLAIVRDVTTRKAAEDALRRAHDGLELRVAERTRELSEANRRIVEEHAKLLQAEKLSSIGLLAAGVAHEINNPLSWVMGLVKALRDGTVPEHRRNEYFDTVRDGLDRMRLTVQGLLDYARPRAPSQSLIDMIDLVSACVQLMTPATRKKEIRVDVRPPSLAHAVQVPGDRSELMQAVVNVLINAVYAAPPRSDIVLTVLSEPSRIGVRIADQGPGIPKEDLARICDPFFSTKPEGEGTGLGLAITLSIVRAHDGELIIKSEEGRGTVVTLWLPVRQGASPHA